MSISFNSLLSMCPNKYTGKGQISCKNGAIFSDLLKETKKDQYISKTLSTQKSIGSGLTDRDYQYLSDKWNPVNMSQDDYDGLLDYLIDKGILTEDDKKYVGYGGEMLVLAESEYRYSPEPPVRDFAEGNLLAYTRYESSVIYSPNIAEQGKHKVELFKIITNVLEEMMYRRGNH